MKLYNHLDCLTTDSRSKTSLVYNDKIKTVKSYINKV